MKCTEYLWKYIDLQATNDQGWSPERTQGEMRAILGDEQVENDVTGEAMTERAAKSVLGRNEKALWDAYHAGDKDAFNTLVLDQMKSDKAHDDGKAEAEE